MFKYLVRRNQPLAIDKSKQLRYFKHIKSLPVAYENNSKSWMNKQMAIKHKKIIPIIDNYTVYLKIKGLKSSIFYRT